jgi:hypothetical protein
VIDITDVSRDSIISDQIKEVSQVRDSIEDLETISDPHWYLAFGRYSPTEPETEEVTI